MNVTRPVLSLRRSLAITVVLLAYSALSAVHAQTCPTHLGTVPLSDQNTAKVSCATTFGRTICSLWCEYSRGRPGSAPEGGSIKLRWVDKRTKADAPKLEDSCGPGVKITYGQRHPSNQATVIWSGTNSTFWEQAEKLAVLMLSRTGDTAVPCAATVEPPDPNRDLPLPPIEDGCVGKLPIARFSVVSGRVDVYDYGFNRWRGPITSNGQLRSCDWIRTAPDSQALVTIYLPGGAEDRIHMAPDTLLELPGPPENSPKPDATFVDLVKGTIRWFSEKPTQQRPRIDPDLRTPTIVTGRHGTEFVIRHDPLTKKDYVFLYSGGLDVKGGGQTVTLKAGQQMYAEGGTLSPIFEMPPSVWTSISRDRAVPGHDLFVNAVQAGVPPSTKTGDTASSANDNSNSRVSVVFRGRTYRTLYQRQFEKGSPIDVYFFEIVGPGGRIATAADGTKLWGKFVRQPSATHDAKAEAVYWFVEWIFRSGRWETVESKSEPFTVVPQK